MTDDDEQLRFQVEVVEPRLKWHEDEQRKAEARKAEDAWRRECREWFDAFDKRMREIFNDRR